MIQSPYNDQSATARTPLQVLALADRRPKIDIIQTVRDRQIDLIITLGDFDRSDLLALAYITDIPKIGVYGNHDSGEYMQEVGIADMHCKIWQYRGLTFGGFQGCVRYKDNPQAIMYTQAEATKLMQGFPPVDVFLSHCPPRGINDEEAIDHQGFNALRQYLDLYHPKVWLHGHTYPVGDQTVTEYNGTRIEYVYEHKILSL